MHPLPADCEEKRNISVVALNLAFSIVFDKPADKDGEENAEHRLTDRPRMGPDKFVINQGSRAQLRIVSIPHTSVTSSGLKSAL